MQHPESLAVDHVAHHRSRLDLLKEFTALIWNGTFRNGRIISAKVKQSTLLETGYHPSARADVELGPVPNLFATSLVLLGTLTDGGGLPFLILRILCEGH